MGTKVQSESYFPGYFSMRDLNEDSNSCSWPPFYGDKTFTNGQYYNGFLPRVIADAHPGSDKDAVKRTMLEHEAIFKKQLHELHRLYGIQRDLMDEIKRKELLKNQIPVETSFSSSPLASQITSVDARKWHILSFPLANSVCARTSASGVEDINSPLSSMKGSSAQASPLPSQNGGASKDMEILECRPSKVRRKMFDLQLPADEYIDTEEGEQLRDENASGISSSLSSRNHKIASQNEMSLFLGNGGKNNCQGDASRSESCLRSPKNVADLNKPIEVEEANASAYVDLLGCTSSHVESRGHELASKPKQELQDFPKEISANFHYRSDNGTLNSPHLQNNANRKCWFPQTLDAGHRKNNLNSVSPDLQPEKPNSQPMQVPFSKTHEIPTVFLTDQGRIDQLRERTARGLELSERNHEISNGNHSESVIASHIPSPYPIGPPSDVGKSWCHSVSCREKPAISLSQKSMSVQMHPYLNSSATLSRGSQSTQTHGLFGDQWNCNSNSTSNPSFASEIPNRNGFYHGSSSGSKESSVRLPSGNYDYWNCTSTNNGASEHFINHSSAKFYKSPNCMDLKSARDVNLNAVLLNSSSNKVVHQQGIEVIDLERKQEDHLAALPWLKAKPACKNEDTKGMDLNVGESTFLQSSLNQFSDKSEIGKGPNQIAIQNMRLTSCSNVVETSTIQGSNSSCRKILGFPIFEKPRIPKNESSSLTSSSVALPQLSEEAENRKKNRVLDINLPCDPAVPDIDQQTTAEVAAVAKEADTKVANFRCRIDLNSCISDDETSLMPSVPGSSAKVVVGIDLEAPAVPEIDENTISTEEKAHEALLQSREHKAESPMNEPVRIAAEAIVAISSSGYQNHLDDATCNPPDASMTDPLHWFVEIVSSCGEDLESKFDAVLRAKGDEDNMETSWEIIDYFESMTLGLIETKEEDYMPKPLVPENLKLEDTGTTPVPTRTRRGQGRRGRQRRDFQRDILPGLASLSRHEVTEDLQTFGGMMRATGHLWHSGLTRRNSTRNGCARGRRRSLVSPLPPVAASPPCTPLIQQLHNIEVGLEDRNLTGWGKTTRRPRRQRCPAGNPQSHPLT